MGLSAEFRGDLKKLKALGGKALGIATRQAINAGAFRLRAITHEQIDKAMILRNKYTLGSIRVEKATGFNPDRMQAKVGSVQKYMETQEFGGARKANAQFLPIPSGHATGEGSAQVRKKLPKGRLKFSKLQVGPGRSNSRVGYYNKGGRRGIYQVTKRKGFRILYNLTKRKVKIPKNPWLRPSVKRVQRELPRIFLREYKKELAHHGL